MIWSTVNAQTVLAHYSIYSLVIDDESSMPKFYRHSSASISRELLDDLLDLVSNLFFVVFGDDPLSFPPTIESAPADIITVGKDLDR
jgi:hypothetical protein